VVLELNLSVLLLYVHGHLKGVYWLVLMLKLMCLDPFCVNGKCESVYIQGLN
jgi:hypothetical protein